MRVLALDLELNQAGIPKIIEIGVCVGETDTGEILHVESFMVNPQELLTRHILDLTGITQAEVDAGTTLLEAYSKLQAVTQRYGVQTMGQTLTWGGPDTEELRNELRMDRESPEWILGRRWVDVKTIFQTWRRSQSKPIQGGLSKSMLKLGLKFDGKKHRAADDAKNTFRMYIALLKKFRA